MKMNILLAASVAVVFAAAPAFAQQGTTLAGPAQGSKANGSSSTRPSGETGASTGAMTREGGAMTKEGGAMSGGATATGGTAGGAAGRN